MVERVGLFFFERKVIEMRHVQWHIKSCMTEIKWTGRGFPLSGSAAGEDWKEISNRKRKEVLLHVAHNEPFKFHYGERC